LYQKHTRRDPERQRYPRYQYTIVCHEPDKERLKSEGVLCCGRERKLEVLKTPNKASPCDVPKTVDYTGRF